MKLLNIYKNHLDLSKSSSGVNMDFVKGIVKKYFRSYNRTLKDGTKKTYKTEQVQVTVSKNDNIFDDKEEVFILSESQAQEILENEEMIAALELFNTILSEENQKLSEDLEEAQNQVYTESSKLKAFTLELDDRQIELDKSNKKLLILKEDCSNLRDQLEESKNTISNLKEQLSDKNFIIEDLNEYIQSLNNRVDSLNTELNTLNMNLNNNNGFNGNNGMNNGLNGVNNGLSNGLNNGLSNGLNNGLNNSLNNNFNEINSGNGFNNELTNGLNANLISSSGDSEDGDLVVSDVKSSISYTYNDYIELQREYLALFKKYEEAQENLYNEKVKVIHYKSLLDKFKSFIARLE